MEEEQETKEENKGRFSLVEVPTQTTIAFQDNLNEGRVLSQYELSLHNANELAELKEILVGKK